MSYSEPRTRLYRIRLNRSGYDSKGYYWGVGAPLYEYTFLWRGRETLECIRASDRDEAKVKIRLYNPNARFYR